VPSAAERYAGEGSWCCTGHSQLTAFRQQQQQHRPPASGLCSTSCPLLHTVRQQQHTVLPCCLLYSGLGLLEPTRWGLEIRGGSIKVSIAAQCAAAAEPHAGEDSWCCTGHWQVACAAQVGGGHLPEAVQPVSVQDRWQGSWGHVDQGVGTRMVPTVTVPPCS
jgi:hypothetical protein